jgi:serine phosphatase RsbU (regulator of sigma subunit)
MKVNDPNRPDSSKTLGQLKRLYLIIVVSVISFLIAQQCLIHYSTTKSKYYARQINVAGKQRMISQKIGRLCLQFQTDKGLHDSLQGVLADWNSDFDNLLNGNEAAGISAPPTEEIKMQLQQVETYHVSITEKVNGLLNGTSVNSTETVAEIMSSTDAFVPEMDHIVGMYETDAERSIDNITYLESVMTIIAILIILLEAYFIFRPTRKIILDQESNLKEKIREMTDSITYAKKVQETILPNQSAFSAHFSEAFVLYMPKDILAGDFYVMESLNVKRSVNADFVLFAVGDCTGHGVPGAMVSIVCHNAIDKAIKELHLTNPADILNTANEIVKNTFSKGEQTIGDGMDISIGCLDKTTQQLTWAGANRPLWIVRSDERETQIIEIKPDKQPIGRFVSSKPFTAHQITLAKNDAVYMFSDGFSDQFGGINGKKFTSRELKRLLVENNGYDLERIHQTLKQAFDTWKGNLEQVDDVTIVGVRC